MYKVRAIEYDQSLQIIQTPTITQSIDLYIVSNI